jgi:glyoxylase-like metal-dependent hydrolase (beta-lactamase superfamily II)
MLTGRKQLFRLTTTIGLVSLLALGAACGDSDDDDPGPSEGSAVDQLIAALGGQEALDAIDGLSIEGSGSRFMPNEGRTPDDEAIEANTFERELSIDFENDALRVDTSRDIEFLLPASEEYTDVIRGNLGASTQPFFGAPLGALSSDKTAAIRRQEVLLTPQLLVRELADATITELDDVALDGVNHHRVVAARADLPPWTLYIDAETGTLSKLETQELDFYQRDTTLEIYYDDWEAAGTTSFPRSLRVVRGAHTLFSEEVSAVGVNPAFAADHFEFPAGETPQFDADLYARGQLSSQWYYLLDAVGLPFTGIDTSITVVEVGEGVFQLVGGSHHSFLVEQADGLVLVDAPFYEERGAALVEFAATEFPGKPIKYVVASHFHEDHVSGIREVLGETDATLVVHASVEQFWRSLLETPSSLKPDALEATPREVEISTVPEGGELVLEDTTRPVTLYHLESQHAVDLLLTHEPLSNAVFVVDIYSPGFLYPAPADLDASITEHAIPTADLKIVGGHGGEIHDYADLQTNLTPAQTAAQ